MHNEHLSSNLDAILPDTNESRQDIFRIGDLASEFNVTLRTLRFYEDRGLLSPERSGSTRLYSQKDRARLKIILLAKRVGFSLLEILEIMENTDSALPPVAQLSFVLGKFKNQINALKVQRAELDESMQELDTAIAAIGELIDQ